MCFCFCADDYTRFIPTAEESTRDTAVYAAFVNTRVYNLKAKKADYEFHLTPMTLSDFEDNPWSGPGEEGIE